MGYKLVEKQSDMRNIFIVTLVGDANDGDYVTETMYLNKDEFEEILPALDDLKDNYSGSEQLEDYPNEMELEIPFNGFDGHCHTLAELSVEYIDENGKIFDVVFDEGDE